MGQITTDFLREIGELTIHIPALKRPTLNEIQEKHPWVRSIERDASPETPVTLKLATVLRKGKTPITGTEYERRLATNLDVLLGYQHWQWLLEHQSEHPAFMALLGKVFYIDFPGIIVVGEDGDHDVPYCRQVDGRWDGDWIWLDSGFNSNVRVAVAGT